MKIIENIVLVSISLFFFVSTINATEIKIERDKAGAYVTKHCGATTDTGYNFSEYKCWNGEKSECVNYKPDTDGDGNGNGPRVDCANFASQALRAGNLDFSLVRRICR